MSDTTRKPKMSDDRRKILNLLEYILEVDTTIDTVYNAFVMHVTQVDEDLSWVNDEEWAQWFEEYANKVRREAYSANIRETQNVDGT